MSVLGASFAASDKVSLAELFRDHHDFIWRCVARMGVTDESVDDVVQDVFLIVSRRLDEFEGRSSARTWLFGIARNVVAHHFRSRTRRERKHRALLISQVPEFSQSAASRQDAATLLTYILAQLDESKREVYILSELEGMTAAEIAIAVGAPVPTVYSRMRSAREQLQKIVARVQSQYSDPPRVPSGFSSDKEQR